MTRGVVSVLLLAVCCGGVARAAEPFGNVLQDLATGALGNREGAVLVMNPRNGRLLAVVNPRLAFEQSYPPGSAIKPFTLLSALSSGRIGPGYSHRCHGGDREEGRNLLCTHPRADTPFSIAEGLAYSCNDLFLAIGERLTGEAFNATLRAFGFGVRTGSGRSESPGRLGRGEWRRETAIGESASLLVTPIQLLRAYQGMVNGGILCRPVRSDHVGGHCVAPAQAQLSPMHRRLLIEGMRGAVDFGTASRAGLSAIDARIFGKTGTSTASNGFRRHGWFVGFAAEPGRGVPEPREVNLAVLVFLKRGSGAEAAAVARPLLSRGISTLRQSTSIPHAGVMVRVRSIGEGRTRRLPLEDYLHGVLRAEISSETEPEALKAQAVVSRTFALANLGRHAAEDYDFCSTTHCQRFESGESGRSLAVRRAIGMTEGEVLRDLSGSVAEVYYHAACGGMTANIETLWGVRSTQPHLRGVVDSFCVGRRSWDDLIALSDLEKVLREDPRTDVGGPLRGIAIENVDRTGRAEWIRLRGPREKLIRGWEFRMIIDRRLGWHLLKSSRFSVSREGGGYRFRGNGFGHGLGLCQDGNHTLALRGHSYRQIIGHYFPRTRITAGAAGDARLMGRLPGDSMLQSIAYNFNVDDDRRRLASEGFIWELPAAMNPRQIDEARQILETASLDLRHRLRSASIPWAIPGAIEVRIHASTAEFIRATGLSGWASGATHDKRIELQPLNLLRHRGLLASTLRHELVHAVLGMGSDRSSPRWLHEGLAIHFAGEGSSLSKITPIKGLTLDELDRQLASPPSHQRARELYATAWRATSKLISEKGEAEAWRRVRGQRSVALWRAKPAEIHH